VTFIRDHDEARWLPSRSHFAAFRLLSFIRFPREHQNTTLGTAYVVDRDQNAFEQFSVALLVLAVTVCYLSSFFSRWLTWPAAAAAGLLLSPAVVQLPYFTMGFIVMPIWRRIRGSADRNNIRANSLVTMGLLLATSVWFAMHGGWTRIIAVAVLSLFFVNAICAVVAWFLRDRFKELEGRCGD
jgi:hypothetical protein